MKVDYQADRLSLIDSLAFRARRRGHRLFLRPTFNANKKGPADAGPFSG